MNRHLINVTVLGRVLLSFMGLLIVGCATTQSNTSTIHYLSDNDGHDYLSHLTTVAVLEPVVEMVLYDLSRDSLLLVDEQQRMSAQMTRSARAGIEQAGFTLSSNPGAIAAPDSRFASRRLIENTIRQLRSESDSESAIGSYVNQIADPLKADAVLVSRYRGWRKTAGQQRKDQTSAALLGTITLGVRTASAEPDSGYLEMALIDGSSGEILWTAIASGKQADADALITLLLARL